MRPTSCAPRSPGPPSSRRWATSTPSTAPPALENNFLETPLSSNVYEDKTYGVPQVTDTLGLMYNKALFEKAGLDPETPPTTWDEVRDAAKALKSKAKVDGIYINSGGYFLLPFLYGEGADIVDTDVRDHHGQQPRGRQGHRDRPEPRRGRHRGEARPPTTRTAP